MVVVRAPRAKSVTWQGKKMKKVGEGMWMLKEPLNGTGPVPTITVTKSRKKQHP